MTENEHTKINVAVIGGDRSVARTLKAHIDLLHELEQYRAIGLTPELIEAMQGHNIALINDLGEYQQIGTIDEFKALKEKNEPKEPDYQGDGCWGGHVVIDTWICPSCGKHYEVDYDDYDYCPNCGQHIDHSGFTEDD